MNQKPHPAVVRLLPSLTDFAFLLPALFLFGRLNGAKTLLRDADTGWHLRTGEWILAHHAVPRQDLFSFTMPGAPWFAWEWLWDVCFGWLHLHFGLAAVVLGSLLVLCAVSALLFRLTLRACGNPLIAIAVTVVAMAGSAIHWLARPHLFTILFAMVWMWVLRRGLKPPLQAEARSTKLWVLPLLTVLWTNLHGGFFVGIVILLMFAGGSLLDWMFDAQKETLRAAGRYALTALGCLAASLINPYTYHLHAHILKYLRDPYQLDNIQEYQSFNLHSPAAGFFELMLGLALLAAARSFARRQFIPLVLIAGWGHLALFSARNIPLFAVVVTPFIAAGIAQVLEEARRSPLPAWLANRLDGFKEACAEFAAMDGLPRAYAMSVVMLALVALGLYLPLPATRWRAEYDATYFPVKALDRLESTVTERRIFTSDQWGDYLAYRFYPRGAKVYIDGRSDFYGSDFGRDYLDLLGVNYKWQAMLDRYSVDTVLMPAASPLSGALKESRRWRVDYDDGVAIVFTSVEKTNLNGFSTSDNKRVSGSSRKAVAQGALVPNAGTRKVDNCENPIQKLRAGGTRTGSGGVHHAAGLRSICFGRRSAEYRRERQRDMERSQRSCQPGGERGHGRRFLANFNDFSTTSGNKRVSGTSPKAVAVGALILNTSTQERTKL